MTKEEFLKGIDNFSSHRTQLWYALETTRHFRLPVLELGCGDGSTPFLQQYCKDNGLELYSYDYNKEWADKFAAKHTDWSNIPWTLPFGVALVDESPGEHRKISLEKLTHVKIVVVHDSEPDGWNASDYQVRQEFDRYKYKLDIEPPQRGDAWTTSLSNFMPLNIAW